MGTFKHKIVRNVFSNWVGYFISIVIAFFLSPFLVHTLGDARYGIWALVGSLTGYLGLFDLGVRSSLVKYVAQYRALNDDINLNRIINTALFVFALSSIAIILISMALAYFLPYIFKIPDEYISEATCIVPLIGINIALSLISGVFGGTLCGFQRYDIFSASAIGVSILKTALLVLVLKTGFGLVAMTFVHIASTIMGLCTSLFFSKKQHPSLQLSSKFINKQTLKTIYSYSVYIFIMTIAVRIVFYTDNIVIGASLSASAITFYAIGANLVLQLKALVLSMTKVFNPAASEFSAQNQDDKVQSLLIKGTKFSLYLVLPIGLGFVIFGKPFITLWMGEKYQISAKVLTILMIPQFFALAQLTAGAILNGLAKHKVNAFVACAEAAANLGLSILLVRYYGIIGVALGTCITLLLTQIFFLPVYTCHVLKLPLLKYFRNAFLPPIIIALPYTALLLSLNAMFYPTSWRLFFTHVGIAVIFFCVLLFTFGIKRDERKFIPVLGNLRNRLRVPSKKIIKPLAE